MENQHRKISGYRELDAAQIDLINAIKEQGNALGLAVEAVDAMPDVDRRAVALAKTHLQTGLMWLVRGITKPEGF
ncbi:MAG: hypothetical protein WDA70_03655 [Lysobacteraceae bacterium]